MESGITKKQSTALQGVAILMMVYHHLFSFATEYVSPLPFIQADIVRRIAWFCKLCVGIFAFVSGYGMYHVMQGQPGERFFGRLMAEYRCVLVRILRLYGKLWLVILIFKGIDFLVSGRPFVAAQLPGNLTALNPTYNGAWWYVEQYAKMLLVLPLLDLLLTRFDRPAESRKKRTFFIVLAVLGLGAALAGRLWLPALWDLLLAVGKSMRISFLLIFVVGYLMARFALYQRLDKALRPAGVWGRVCVSVTLIAVVIAVRVPLATDASYARLDFILTPLLVYGLLTLLDYVKPLSTFLVWWGRQSTYIWLVHVFFYEWLQHAVRSSVRLDIWVYLAVLLASAAVSFALKAPGNLASRLLRREGQKRVTQ